MLRLQTILTAAAAIPLAACITSSGRQWTAPPCTGTAPATLAECGPHPVEEMRNVVRDPARERDIPFTMYLPGSAERYPLIVFSHGLGNSHDGYRYLGRFWASHGFAVVHVGHRGSDTSALTTRGPARVVLSFFDRRHWHKRVADIEFLVAHLTQTWEPTRRRVEAVGVAGHSFGALAATKVLARSGDVRAGLLLSPPRLPMLLDPDELARVRVPLLHMIGEHERSLLFGDAIDDPSRFFANFPQARQYLVILEEAEHATFSDDVERPDGDHARRIRYVQKATLMFWEATLRTGGELAVPDLERVGGPIAIVVGSRQAR